MASVAPQISFDDFMKVDVRVGTIVAAEPFPEARKPAFKLQIDFGPQIGVKKSSAQITVRHTLDELVGRQVMAVVNFPPRRVAGFESQVLVLGVPDERGEIILLQPERDAPLTRAATTSIPRRTSGRRSRMASTT